jgi:DNA adenine methylase
MTTTTSKAHKASKPTPETKPPRLKSPLAWVGGKSQLTDTILPLIPPHKNYVEVFAGAAWVLFRKPESKGEIINDINGDLVTLYRVIQNHLEEFVRYFKWALVSRDEFERMKRVERSTLTDIQRSALFYYLLRNSFGAKISDASFGVTATHKPRLNLLRIEEDLSAAHLRLSRVFIENMAFQRVIERFDRKETFFYVDPPYWDCEDVYGKGLFSKADFVTLRDQLAACKGKWLVSINNVPQIRELFKGFYIREVQTTYSLNAGSPKPVTELLIANYALD